MLSRERENEVIVLCQNLIRTQSYSGNEEGVANILNEYMTSHGFDDVIIDRYGDVIGVIRGSRPGKNLLFDGHIDTVPVPNASAWTHDPFGAEIVDGKIYGRGTSDMKGADAAMVCACAEFVSRHGHDFAGNIYFSGVVHEECFEGVAARNISANVEPDYVIIGEATNLNLKVGQRGRAEICVETFGKPAHSANPEKGINAVYSMCELIGEIRKIVPFEQEKLGKGILELTDIKSMPYPGASVVPDYCRATFDRRLLVGETKESVLKPINEIIERMEKENPSFHAKTSYSVGSEKCYTGNTVSGERFFPGWIFDEKEVYVQKIVKSLNELGYDPEITTYNFCTNGSHYAGEAGIRTIGLGPSLESLAHTIDEYIEIDQLTKVTDCYVGVIEALCGSGDQ